METTKCPKCDKEFSAQTAGRASQAVRMHINRVHKRNFNRKKGSFKPKRKYTKRPNIPNDAINFCPCCGCPIGVVRSAIGIIHKLS